MRAALSLFVLLLLLPSVTHPAPKDEYKKLQEKMRETTQKITETRERESSILSEIDEINLRLQKIEAELSEYRRIMRRTQSEIAKVNADIARTEKSVDDQKEWLTRKIRAMQRFGRTPDAVLLVLSGADTTQTMRALRYLEKMAKSEKDVLAGYRENLKTLNDEQTRLQSLKTEIGEQTKKVRAKEEEVAEQKRAKGTILASVRNERATYRKMLAEMRESARRLLEIIRESARSDSYSGQGFSRLKGKLLWPVDGRIAIPYGTQRDKKFETPVFRNGVHIQTSSDTEARSVYAGRVIFAEWFKGFGQLVIVNHGSGYHTLYGNLSEIFSHVGDIIKENQVIGKVGTSGLLNAPGLYFEIRYKGKPLDPAQWLKHRRG